MIACASANHGTQGNSQTRCLFFLSIYFQRHLPIADLIKDKNKFVVSFFSVLFDEMHKQR